MRIVHYLNQFFAGQGGEELAGAGPAVAEGAVGPGRRLQALLGSEHEIVATVWCGDDYAAGTPGATAEILALAAGASPQLVVAGPAFGSGRYGMACATVAAAACETRLTAIACMHPDNPGLAEAGTAPVVASGETARQMKGTLEGLAAAVATLAAGGPLGPADGLIARSRRVNLLAASNAAERAVELLVARLGGDRDRTEIPVGDFDRVTPAGPVADPSQATIALVTEGGLVPEGNPDALESARATKWLRYALGDTLPAGEFESIHGGFSTVAANAAPHRIVPLDVARELEGEGAIGRLHTDYLVTAGNGTAVAMARRFGVEWAAELRRAGVHAVILTAT